MKSIAVMMAIIVVIAACTATGVLQIEGEIRSTTGAAPKDCQLQLLAPTSDASEYYRPNIDPKGFSESFSVPPRSETYPVVLTCSGFEPARAVASFSSHQQPAVDLGVVLLKPL